MSVRIRAGGRRENRSFGGAADSSRSLRAKLEGDGYGVLPDRCLWPPADRLAQRQSGGRLDDQEARRVGFIQRQTGGLGTVWARVDVHALSGRDERAGVPAADRFCAAVVAGHQRGGERRGGAGRDCRTGGSRQVEGQAEGQDRARDPAASFGDGDRALSASPDGCRTGPGGGGSGPVIGQSQHSSARLFARAGGSGGTRGCDGGWRSGWGWRRSRWTGSSGWTRRRRWTWLPRAVEQVSERRGRAGGGVGRQRAGWRYGDGQRRGARPQRPMRNCRHLRC